MMTHIVPPIGSTSTNLSQQQAERVVATEARRGLVSLCTAAKMYLDQDPGSFLAHLILTLLEQAVRQIELHYHFHRALND